MKPPKKYRYSEEPTVLVYHRRKLPIEQLFSKAMLRFTTGIPHHGGHRMDTASFSPFTIFAHRGASGLEPENTLRSFRRAIELGAEWVELDVRLVEGTPVVFHDRTLSRRTGKSGVVESQSLHFLRSLDVGLGEQIPTLAEALELLHGRAHSQIELKGPGCAQAVAQLLGRAISEGAAPDSFLVSSFDSEQTLLCKRLLPEVPVACLTYGYPQRPIELAASLSAVSFHFNIDAVTPQRVRELKAAGLKVFVYTVNSDADLQFVLKAGVDGVFTDFPGRIYPDKAGRYAVRQM